MAQMEKTALLCQHFRLTPGHQQSKDKPQATKTCSEGGGQNTPKVPPPPSFPLSEATVQGLFKSSIAAFQSSFTTTAPAKPPREAELPRMT